MLSATVKTTTYMGWILGVGRRFDGKWVGWILDQRAALLELLQPDQIQPNCEAVAKALLVSLTASMRDGSPPSPELSWKEEANAGSAVRSRPRD